MWVKINIFGGISMYTSDMGGGLFAVIERDGEMTSIWDEANLCDEGLWPYLEDERRRWQQICERKFLWDTELQLKRWCKKKQDFYLYLKIEYSLKEKPFRIEGGSTQILIYFKGKMWTYQKGRSSGLIVIYIWDNIVNSTLN